MTNNKKQPKTKIDSVSEKIYGVRVVDQYRWLEKNNEEVSTWIKNQQKYTESLINKIPVREKITRRLKELYQIDSIGVPVPCKGHYFFFKRKNNEDLSVLYVKKGLNGKPKVLIDQNKLSKEKTTIINDWAVSWDAKFLAYELSKASNDKADIWVMDVDTGKNLKDVIPGDFYPSIFSWKPDSSGFWYARSPIDVPKGEEKFYSKLYFHKIGDDFKNDSLVYGKDLAKEDQPSSHVSKDGRYLLVTVYFSSTKKEKTEIYLKDLNNPESDFLPVIKGIDSLFYGSISGNTIFVKTNHNAANWKLMSIKINDIKKGIKKWKTIIPENRLRTIGDYIVISNNLFVEFLKNAHSLLKSYNLLGKLKREIKLPGIGSISVLSGEEDSNELFFNFSSYTTPGVVYRYDLKSKNLEEFEKLKLKFDEKLFIVEQIWYLSKDKVKIPMFVIHKKEIKLDGNNPVILYGYGGFNISTTPYFNRTVIPFLEDGGVYVETNLRGGGEFGEEWHKSGMKDKKQNVFDDFIAAAEWLIKNKYTNKNKLGIFGWSNGGLLVGATITQRPNLFKVAIVGAPVLDMMRYHLFDGGRYWIQEYGSMENEDEFKYLLKYSPYHNVKNGEFYPATLILTADKDDRVSPMHAFKMTAKLQKANKSDNPILIRIETQAGHSGAASINHFIQQYADMWSFIYWQMKIE